MNAHTYYMCIQSFAFARFAVGAKVHLLNCRRLSIASCNRKLCEFMSLILTYCLPCLTIRTLINNLLMQRVNYYDYISLS